MPVVGTEWDITIDFTDIIRAVQEYCCEQLSTCKTDTVEEMDQFPEITNYNNSPSKKSIHSIRIAINEVEFII